MHRPYTTVMYAFLAAGIRRRERGRSNRWLNWVACHMYRFVAFGRRQGPIQHTERLRTTSLSTAMLSLNRSGLVASSLRRRASRVALAGKLRKFSSPSPPPNQSSTPGGAAQPGGSSFADYTKGRGPVSWMSLFLVGVAAASVTAYYKLERERRLEQAMRKVVSSESEGWSPNPEVLAKRKFKRTPWGWFPEEDAFGAAGKPAIGGPWTLVDMDGKLVTNKQFEGKWLLLYFGFARCPDICPSEMVKVGKVMDTLKSKYPELYKKVVPVFVSVDPARDSLKALKKYGEDFHPSFIFLTGAPTQVQEMAKKYRVYVSKADESPDGDYLVDHSIVIYFHDDTGDLADCFTQSMKPSDVVEKVVERMTFVPSY